MKIKNTDGLQQKLEASEDAEVLGENHYALDLYDNEPMLTLEIEFTPKDGAEVTAAAVLKYSDAMDGYYMDERITDAEIVDAALAKWMQS